MRRLQSVLIAPRDPATRPKGQRRSQSRSLLLVVFLGLTLVAEFAAPRIQNPVLVQAKKDLSVRNFDLAIPALEDLLKTELDKITRNDGTLTLGQAYLDRATLFSRSKDDSNASTTYDTAIALLEPFLKAATDRKIKDGADKLLSQAYMSNADANIRLKNYDKALKSLQSFSSNYPERFDQANNKVKAIFAIREKYTKLASEIRDRALSTNGKDPAIPGMIDQLKSFDPYANKQILTTLLEVQVKVRNLALLKETMTAARGQIDKGDYIGALGTYLRGFAPDSTLPALFWQEFLNAGYDIRDSATGQLLAINEEGKVQLFNVEVSGRALRTDAAGKIAKGPGGAALPLLDASGKAVVFPLIDFGGQRQLDRNRSVVAATERIVNEVAALVRGMGGARGRSTALTEAMGNLRAAFAAGDASAVAAALPVAEKAFADFDADRLAIAARNAALVEIYGALPKKGADGLNRSVLDYSYLNYSELFIAGRPFVTDYDARTPELDPIWRPEAERDKTEGVSGALFTQAFLLLDATHSAMLPPIESGFSDAVAAWENGNWEEARTGFGRVAALDGQAERALGFWKGLAQVLPQGGPSGVGLGPLDLPRLAEKQMDIAVVSHQAELSAASARLAVLRKAIADKLGAVEGFIAALPPGSPLPDPFAVFADFRKSMKGYEADLVTEVGAESRLRASADKAAASLASYSQPSEAPGQNQDAWEHRLRATQVDFAVAIHQGELSVASARLSAIRKAIADKRAEVERFVAALQPGSPLPDSLARLTGFRKTMQGYAADLDAEAGAASSLRAAADRATAALASYSLPSGAPGQNQDAWELRLNAAQDEAQTGEIAIVALSTGLEIAALEKEEGANNSVVTGAVELTKGHPSTIEARRGLLDPSPTNSAVTLASEEAPIAELARSEAEFATRISAELPYVKSDASIVDIATRSADLSRRTQAMSELRSSALADALVRQKTSAAALATATQSFAEAENILAGATEAMMVIARRQAARDALEQATTAREAGYGRFLDAMNVDFDARTWDTLLARYQAIKTDINAARDQFARLEVDRLLADAQHSYDLSNFDVAYDSLTKASALWKENYPSLSYPPLDFWLNLVRMARDTGNTRVIRQNDPLYREMTQYLSLARMKFDSGINLQKSAKEADARRTFAEAQAIIANVTRTFPLNADAGFLSLQILKATNEADFRLSLPNRIGDAAALLKSDPAAGYARISDLSRLEPANAQLKKLLAQAEVATGKRRPEPTTAEKARSLQLTEQARQLMKTGRQADLTLAEQRLAEATGLDPNNRDSQTLSLNIQTLKGGGPDKQLGVENSRRLSDARLQFSQGQYNQARDTLNALLASETTKTRDVLLLDAQLNQLNY